MVDAEAVHAQGEAGVGHRRQVVGVADRVAAVAEDDPAEVDALLPEHRDDRGAVLARGVRVDGDRRAAGRDVGAAPPQRSTRSTPSVSPFSSTAHLSMPALTPVPAMPSVMSRTKNSVIVSRGRCQKNIGTSSKV